MRRLLARLLGSGVPEGFQGELAEDEAVVAVAALRAGNLVATTRGLWVPDGDGVRCIGWHLISKATWSGTGLTLVEAEESETAGKAVLLRDLPPVTYAPAKPGKLPQAVNVRVTGSIRSRHHQAGAWFVQRKVAGQDGIVLQVRPDAGADLDVLRSIAADVAARIDEVRDAVE